MHFSQRDHLHPDYKDNNQTWTDAWRSYTGTYATKHIDEYLHRKEQRETTEAFEERKDLTDPVLHFPTAVDGLNGILFAKDSDTEREWGELGDPEEPDSIAYTLKRNADGNGTDWNPLMKQAGIRLTVMHKIWGLVEGVQTETDEQGNTVETLEEAKVKVLNPQSVVNWYPDTGNPRQVLVKEQADTRTGIRDTEGEHQAEVYVLYELDGWTRFKIEEYEDKNGDTQTREIPLGEGSYEYWADTDKSMKILPIFPVEIPMPRHVGHLLAKKQEHIFNKKSRRDAGIGNLSFALLQICATHDQYKDALSNLEKGYNTIRLDPDARHAHQFMTPDGDYLADYADVLEKDKEDFYDAAFKQYGDAAKQVTATEIRLESRSGIEAFLTLLVSSIDEFEEACLWRLTQVYHDNTSAWGTASVKRSRSFQPEDIQEMIKKLTERYVGDDSIPLDSETKASVIERILELDNIQADEDAGERIKAILDNMISSDQATAVQRASEGMSTEAIVRALHPEWKDSKINKEVGRIREQSGAVPVPESMNGG